MVVREQSAFWSVCHTIRRVLLVPGDVVLTMDPDRRMLADGGVLVDGDRIVAVGSAAELTAQRAGRRAPRRARPPRDAGPRSTPTSTSPATAWCARRSPTTSTPGMPSSSGRCRSTPPTPATTTSCRRRSGSSRRSPTGSRSPSRPAPSPTPTGCSPATTRSASAARSARGVGRRRARRSPGRSTRCSTASGSCSTSPAGHPRVHGWVTLVGHDLMSDELVDAGPAPSPARPART